MIDAQDLPGSWFAGLLGLQVYAWKPMYIHLWNSPGWSVAVEMFFYALFPAILAYVQPLSTRWLVRLLMICWVLELAWIGWVAARTVDLETLNLYTYFWPPARLGEFVIGVGLGVLWTRGALKNWSSWWGLAALAVLSALPYLATSSAFLSVFYPPLTGVLVVSLAQGGWWSRPLMTGTLQRLGEASYAIYIIHWLPLIPLVAWAQQGAPPSPLLVGAFVCSALLLALGLHHVLERPAYAWLVGAQKVTGVPSVYPRS